VETDQRRGKKTDIGRDSGLHVFGKGFKSSEKKGEKRNLFLEAVRIEKRHCFGQEDPEV